MKRFVRTGKRGSYAGSYIVIPSTRIGKSAKLGAGGRDCSAGEYSGSVIDFLNDMQFVFVRQKKVMKWCQPQM